MGRGEGALQRTERRILVFAGWVRGRHRPHTLLLRTPREVSRKAKACPSSPAAKDMARKAFLENRQDPATLVQLVCNPQLRRWPSSWKTIGASSHRTELDPISARKTMRDTKEEQATEDPQRLPSEDT